MATVLFLPHPALLEYVDSVVVLDLNFAAGTGLSPLYTFVPTHTRFLCFYLQDPVKVKKQTGGFAERARSIIIGPQLTPVTLDLGRAHQTVIVRLKPCGLYRLLGIPMEELPDRDYDARAVVGREIDDVLEQLSGAPGKQEQNAIVQRYLLGKLRQLRPALPFDRAVLQLVVASGNLPIDRVAAQACLSVRQFERQARQRLGPKLYGRLVRFSHAYKFKEIAPHTPWHTIAYRCGYFDQMHLIRDFKFFAGFTPSKLRAADVKKSVRFRMLEDVPVAPRA